MNSVGMDLLLMNLPMLVEVKISSAVFNHILNCISSRLSCVISQLVVLHLTTHLGVRKFFFAGTN